VNIIDGLILLLIVLLAIRGYELGLVRQASSIIGFVAGLIAGNWLAKALDSSLLASACIIVLSILIMAALAEALAIRLRAWLHAGKLGIVDHIGGSLGGVLVAGALVWIGSIVLPLILPPSSGHLVRDSVVIGWIDRSVPPATDVLAALEDALSERGLPGAIQGAITPQPDASLPSHASLAGVSDAAQPSVLRIEGRACEGIGTGSGYAASDDLIVTNAHVVAGMRYPFVETSGGQRHTATVAHFDPSLDIAVLRVPDLRATALSFADTDPAVGAEAVVLGYPGGGAFTFEPARVLEHFTAVSGDIYGENEIRRSVFALHANVKPGNSGGPVLNRAGQVIGTTFARSTTNEAIGYMLTAEDSQDAVASAEAEQYTADDHLRCAAE
jgi:S1-C subfamily serine protease